MGDDIFREKIRGEKDPGDLEKSFFISAGAGAGKTTLLVDRVSSLLKNGVKPSEIVVITFTNAAAAEIRTRISDKVRELTLEDCRVDDMIISTIHGFCHMLVKMRSFDSGLGLSSELIDKDEEQLIKENYFKKYISKHLNDQDILDLKIWIGDSYDTGLIKQFCRMSEREGINYIDNSNLCGISFDDVKKEALTYIPKLINRIKLSETALAGISVNYNGFLKDKDGVKKVLSEIEANQDLDSAFTALEELRKSNDKFKTFGERGKNKDSIALENVNLRGAYKQIIDSFFTWFEAVRACHTVRTLEKIANSFQKNRDKKKITNDGILSIAKKVTESAEAQSFFREKYKYFFVDEYQDTDDKQMDIIWNLAGKYVSGEEKGGLVVVGDVKQAIYRFRGADSDNFEKMKSTMESNAPAGMVETVELTSNYRSNNEIISWVNDTFGPRFVNDFGQSYENMVASPLRSSYSGNVLEGVYSAEGNSPEDVRELIEKLINNGREIAFKKREKIVENGVEVEKDVIDSRKIKYSDIMILTSSMTNHPDYANELKAHGIPVNVYGKNSNILVTEAIKTFYAYVDYLSSPYDQHKKGLLIQYLAGKDYLVLSSEELSTYFYKIKCIRKYLSGLNAIEIAGYFQKHLELILPQEKSVDPNQYIEVQKAFDSLFENLMNDNVQDFREMLELIGSFINESPERLADLEEDRDAVFITNMHKAKGLQSSIVIIADRKKGEVRELQGPYKEGNDYYEVVYLDYGFGNKNTSSYRTFALDKNILDKAQKADRLDDLRLSYVAATRAKEVLIYMTPDDENAATCRMGRIADDLPDIEDELWVEGSDDEEDLDDVNESNNEDDKAIENNNKKYTNEEDTVLCGDKEAIKKRTYLTINPSGMEHRESKDKVSDKDRPKGNIFGNVMHRSFELLVGRLDEIRSAAPEEINKVVDAVIVQAILESLKDFRAVDNPEEFAKYLKDKISEFIESDLFKEILDAEEVYPEYAFSFTLYGEEAENLIAELGVKDKSGYEDFVTYEYSKNPDDTTGKLWVNGISDLVIVRKSGDEINKVIIIDYKSDSIICDEDGKKMSNAEFKKVLEKRYRGQLQLYKAAIKHSMGIGEDKIECHIYSMYEK